MKAECLKEFAVTLAECNRILYYAPLEVAARGAVRRGGPTFEQQLERIAAIRAEVFGTTPSYELEKWAGAELSDRAGRATRNSS